MNVKLDDSNVMSPLGMFFCYKIRTEFNYSNLINVVCFAKTQTIILFILFISLFLHYTNLMAPFFFFIVIYRL